MIVYEIPGAGGQAPAVNGTTRTLMRRWAARPASRGAHDRRLDPHQLGQRPVQGGGGLPLGQAAGLPGRADGVPYPAAAQSRGVRRHPRPFLQLPGPVTQVTRVTAITGGNGRHLPGDHEVAFLASGVRCGGAAGHERDSGQAAG